jgi:hypothetical protein
LKDRQRHEAMITMRAGESRSSNIQHRMLKERQAVAIHSTFDAGCSMFDVHPFP